VSQYDKQSGDWEADARTPNEDIEKQTDEKGDEEE
jgi:hypothetical protein